MNIGTVSNQGRRPQPHAAFEFFERSWLTPTRPRYDRSPKWAIDGVGISSAGRRTSGIVLNSPPAPNPGCGGRGGLLVVFTTGPNQQLSAAHDFRWSRLFDAEWRGEDSGDKRRIKS